MKTYATDFDFKVSKNFAGKISVDEWSRFNAQNALPDVFFTVTAA